MTQTDGKSLQEIFSTIIIVLMRVLPGRVREAWKFKSSKKFLIFLSSSKGRIFFEKRDNDEARGVMTCCSQRWEIPKIIRNSRFKKPELDPSKNSNFWFSKFRKSWIFEIRIFGWPIVHNWVNPKVIEFWEFEKSKFFEIRKFSSFGNRSNYRMNPTLVVESK